MKRVVIIDFEMGNFQSVWQRLKRLGIEATGARDHNQILQSSHLIIPGVGHFGKAVEKLKRLQLIEPLGVAVQEYKIPILGICLGMQLMTRYSEEGDCEGLGWVDAQVKRLILPDNRLKVPQMGWNTLKDIYKSPMMEGVDKQDEFYFVHSYGVQCNDQADVVSTTDYGQEFVSAFQRENVWGVQFHPEKSQEAGSKILSNFLGLK